jgi:tetratricopeptide (TPR) repeat protein
VILAALVLVAGLAAAPDTAAPDASASGAPSGAAALPPGAKKDFEKGMAAYKKQDYAGAEKSFRALVASMPDSAMAHLYLGHSIFYQERFRDSIPDYEKARDLELKSAHLELVNRRILNDQLGMAYGLSGRIEDAKKHFQTAITADPDYPLYYYNLACAEAELGDLDGALANLKQASDHRANFLPGESLPDPREDDSFKKYKGNPKFEATVKEIGF